MVRTEDGFILDGVRVISIPWGKYVPVSELIGATIVSINQRHGTFSARICEKTIHAESNDNGGITISRISIPFEEGDSVKPIDFPDDIYTDGDEEEDYAEFE